MDGGPLSDGTGLVEALQLQEQPDPQGSVLQAEALLEGVDVGVLVGLVVHLAVDVDQFPLDAVVDAPKIRLEGAPDAVALDEAALAPLRVIQRLRQVPLAEMLHVPHQDVGAQRKNARADRHHRRRPRGERCRRSRGLIGRRPRRRPGDLPDLAVCGYSAGSLGTPGVVDGAPAEEARIVDEKPKGLVAVLGNMTRRAAHALTGQPLENEA